MNVHRISRAGLRNKVNIVNKLKQFVFQFILLVQVLDVDISIDAFEFKAGEYYLFVLSIIRHLSRDLRDPD